MGKEPNFPIFPGENTEKFNLILIQASSAGFNAGNFAKITMNSMQVPVEKNESGHYRGLHLVIINPKSGQVESAKVFDTYKTSAALDELIRGGIPFGSIVVAACKDDCATNLSKYAKSWFAKMGSKEIWKLGYRQGFAFIGVLSGKDEFQEKRAAHQYTGE